MNKYIGIPFLSHGRAWHGVDCWGLVRLYYEREKGIDLPSLDTYTDTKDAESISKIIYRQKTGWIQTGWVKTDTPKTGDVVVLKIAGKETHVGIYLEGNKMLHIMNGINSCVESLKSPKWKNRISGIYKYE